MGQEHTHDNPTHEQRGEGFQQRYQDLLSLSERDSGENNHTQGEDPTITLRYQAWLDPKTDLQLVAKRVFNGPSSTERRGASEVVASSSLVNRQPIEQGRPPDNRLSTIAMPKKRPQRPSATAVQSASLVDQTGTGNTFILNKPLVTLGRSPINDIVLAVPKISLRHAEFVYQNEQWLMRDLCSPRGSYVNGLRVYEHLLMPGDRVMFGEQVLEFEPEAAPSLYVNNKLLQESEGLNLGFMFAVVVVSFMAVAWGSYYLLA